MLTKSPGNLCLHSDLIQSMNVKNCTRGHFWKHLEDEKNSPFLVFKSESRKPSYNKSEFIIANKTQKLVSNFTNIYSHQWDTAVNQRELSFCFQYNKLGEKTGTTSEVNTLGIEIELYLLQEY